MLVGVANCGESLATVGETGRKDVAVANHLAIHDLLLVDHIKLVALADILSEVDVVAEDPCQIHGHAVRQAGALTGCRQRTLDYTVGISRAHHRFADFAIEGVTVCAFGQANGFQVADLAVQAGQLTVLVQLDLQHLTTFELAELFRLFVTAQHFLHSAGRQADLGEQGRQGVATAHGHFAMARVLGWGGLYWRRCSSRLDLGGLLGGRRAVVDLGKR
ncbi:hypothetical protein D3C80_1350150 [compost metagenome]